MHNNQQTIVKQEGIFFYLFLLTVFLFLAEFSFFIQCNSSYLSDYTFVSDSLHIPATIVPDIVFFLFAQLIIHFAFCVSIWLIAIFSLQVFYVKKFSPFHVGISLWLLSCLTVIVANQYLYPNSRFAELSSQVFFNEQMLTIAFIFLLIICSFVLLTAVLGAIKMLVAASRWVRATFLLAGVLATFALFSASPVSVTDASTMKQPNIILIGLDSLRPDFLGFFGNEIETPFLDTFLKQATVFSEAVTPLARTFPSWSGILTGQYPRQINIRSNLAQQQQLNLRNTLPAILQRNGYESIYATDETRFSNMSMKFGFNRILTPPIGLNDFLLGTFNDFPLSNLLVNTVLGKLLFPYSYANRPAYVTYDPDSFLDLIKPAFFKQRSKPLFMAVHFCLPHSPYLWASQSGNHYSAQERYVKSIARADQQVSRLFAMLKQAKVLDHAIVVLLSDHGEALELPGDRITEKELYIANKAQKAIVPVFYPPSLDEEAVNQSAGHGTDVLGLPQYHTLLAFKLFNQGEQQASIVPGVVSMLDIKPTLLALLHLASPDSSGVSLLGPIRNTLSSPLPSEHIFLESDFSPAAIHTVYPETRQVMLEGIDLFQIDPVTTRLTVKPSMVTKIIKSKQYADIYGEWMLALYPQNAATRMPILINLKTGLWTNDLHTSFAMHSPAQIMLDQLKSFYGSEIDRI